MVAVCNSNNRKKIGNIWNLKRQVLLKYQIEVAGYFHFLPATDF